MIKFSIYVIEKMPSINDVPLEGKERGTLDFDIFIGFVLTKYDFFGFKVESCKKTLKKLFLPQNIKRA